MNTKKMEFSVGIFVLIGLAAILYLAIQVGGSRFLAGDTQTYVAHFSNIGGLNQGSNVMIAGVKVGSVGDIELDQEKLIAKVELKIERGITLYADTIASIKTNGLIGDKYVSVDPGGALDIELDPSEPIVDTESALDIESLISRFAFGSVEEEGGGGKSGE